MPVGPEDIARQNIDEMLVRSGWLVQDLREFNPSAAKGIAVREFPMKNGEADYLLYAGEKAGGVVEAKPEGTTLSGVAEQTERYSTNLPEGLPNMGDPLPFAYESTGTETYFRDLRDPSSRSRRIFYFHKPETLIEWAGEEDTLRKRLQKMPQLDRAGLRDCQFDAIANLEKSLYESRSRALIQMATGSGKTLMAVNSVYRLIKHAGARRILFLVDRSNLGRQALKEFQQYRTPDDGRLFSELYNVQHLTSNKLDPVARVCITTIQRLYSMLRAESEFDDSLEERSGFDLGDPGGPPREVAYNPALPIEFFDFIITDECHRSIYNLWRQVLEYYDAFLVGLTATPSKQTLGFFQNNLVMEYNHERAVADGINVGYEVYRIRTRITEKGSTVEAGLYIDTRDRETRARCWERLDEDLVYSGDQLDRTVVSEDQIRTIVKTIRDKLSEIFPGRTDVPKTLIFAKDDSHAEDITHIVREEFAKGNDFCKKITYRTTGVSPESLIQSFRNSYNPRIAVTVDMISTGTDIRPLECLVFMRDVKSRVYFDQMKGRGTRTITPTDLKAVTSDAEAKTHYVIIDAVGVTESDKGDSRPLERKPHRAFDKLLLDVALGKRDEDTLSSLAGRLARLDRASTPEQRDEIESAADGRSIKTIINNLLDALDPDKQIEKAQKLFGTEVPTAEQLKESTGELARAACAPFNNPQFRETLSFVKQKHEQIIDTISIDEVIDSDFDHRAKERAQGTIESFQKFIEENKDELIALQILYSQPYGKRKLTYSSVRELAAAIGESPYILNVDQLWWAYEQLERARVKKMGPDRLLTNIISLVRFAIGQEDILSPYAENVEARFEKWLKAQERAGRIFTPEQMQWLGMIKDHIAASITIEREDFQDIPFRDRGGPIKAEEVFGKELDALLRELNQALVA